MKADAIGKTQPTKVRWLILGLACGTSWFLYLHRYTWNFIRPELQKEYDFSNTQLESLYTAFNASYLLGQIPGGVICDFFGPHFFLATIIVLWSLAMPLLGVTGNVYGLGAIRFTFGAAQAGCYPGLAKVSRVWFPAAKRTAMQGLVASFFGRAGGAMSSIIMGSVLMGIFGLNWRVSLVVLAVAGLLFAVVFAWLYRNTPAEDSRVNEAELELLRDDKDAKPARQTGSVLPAGRVVRSPSMLVFIVQQFLNAGADNIYVYLTGSYFLTKTSNPVLIGLMASLPLWGGALGGLCGGFLNDGLIRRTDSRRWSRTSVGFSGKFMACIVMLIAVNQTGGWAVAIGLFIVKFFSDWTQPTVWGTCTDMGGKYSATVFSVINTSGGVGGLVMPLIFGMVLDYNTTKTLVDGQEVTTTNYTPIFVIVAVMYLLSALSWFFINCTHSLDDPEPSSAEAAQ